MKYPPREQANLFSEKAIKYLQQADASPVPHNYELFFTYAAGTDDALKRLLDQRLADGGTMSPSELRMLYDSYRASAEKEERLSELGDQLGEEVKEALGLVEQTVDSISDFSGSLADIGAELGDFSDPAKIRTAFTALVQRTQAMEQDGLLLKQKLAKTTLHISRLQDGLNNALQEAQTDFLTGIANRKCFDQTLENEIAKAKMTGQPLCLGMIDIDHFKAFNDTFGHQIGDSVIRVVAVLLKNAVRETDLAARYGGEEFAFIMPNTWLDTSIKAVERIRRALSAKELKRSTGEKLGFITISTGISVLRPDDNSEKLLERADRCLYEAKHSGRNRIVSETGDGVAGDAFVNDEQSAEVA